jgi:hypothetical protein
MWRIRWTLKDGRQFTNHYLAAKGVVRLGDYRKWMKELGTRMP